MNMDVWKKRCCLSFGLLATLLGTSLTWADEDSPNDDEHVRAAAAPADVELDPATAARVDRFADLEEADGTDVFQATSFLLQPPLPPIVSPPPSLDLAARRGTHELTRSVFGSDAVRRSLIAESRQTPMQGPASDIVLGPEGSFRVTTDAGNLLGQSAFAPGVRVQQRTPVVSDPRVRGSRTGRLLASGSYWAPAREDLDTLLSKIDSRDISDVIVIKGPYTSMLGPGFYFVDFRLLDTPRFEDGPEWHGSTGLEYKSNGQQWYGRQTLYGGGENYGYRVSYGRRSGSDYTTGAGDELPSSYNSGNLNVALGYDFSPDASLEFHYLRLDQDGVEFPQLVFDINNLVTNGFELRYTLKDQPNFDLLTLEGWYNQTRFVGDTSRPGKNQLIRSLRESFLMSDTDYLTTNVNGMSAGYRAASTWGQPDAPKLTVGTDLIRVGQELTDVAPSHQAFLGGFPLLFDISRENRPIPQSHTLDFGLFAEHSLPYDNGLTLKTGARVDFVSASARNNVPDVGYMAYGFPPILDARTISDLKQAGLDQQFYPWSVFMSADYKVNCCWTLTGGAGYGIRPPTLTELYARGPFIGSLQQGLTFVDGDPLLRPERQLQVDLGLHADLDQTRFGLSGYHAWVNDYITFDDIGERYHDGLPSYIPGQDLQHVAYVNTDYATLYGFELTGEHDVTDSLTGFALMSYVEGRDHTRTTPSRIAGIIRDVSSYTNPQSIPRSFNGTVTDEPLPGIPPLETRLGLRVKQPCPKPDWAVELEARIVSRQDLVAATLSEEPTSGFTVWNLRGFCRPHEQLTVFSGVENMFNRYYREHLDFRAGRGVYRPGTNFYVAAELAY